ncbi:MAG TPA: class I SAM-dependent methyltransferase [Myxococcaceae bacterium]|nr:class I SAM-dependent methyltransferase [Myxococcaceae bacterium]
MSFDWPKDFQRIPDADWTTAPLDPLGQRYDSMARHLWYTNLELTLEQLSAALKPGQVLIDYSGGTGILARQLLQRVAGIGVVMVDASPRFLRVALEHFREQPRVAFRLLNYLEGQRRLQRLDEVLEPALVQRGVDGLVSTNAVHLYPDLEDTFQAWARVVRPGGKVFVQSGDIRNPEGKPGEWLISEVVAKVREVAREVAAGDPRYAPYREVLANPERMAAYDALWRKVFLPIRPVSEYREALTRAGFTVTGVITRTVDVGVLEWYEATSVYPDLLAWVGGSPKVDRRQPTPSELQDRLDLLKQSFLKLFSGRDVYQSTWTYLVAEK